MCDCKKEIDPKPGEVWLMRDGMRHLVVAINNTQWPYKTVNLRNGSMDCFSFLKAFDSLSEDQSHNVILPNAAPQPLKLEVGKVYCLDHREGRRALIISENMAAFDVIFLDEAGIRHGIYSCSKNGVFLDEASREDYAGRKSILFCLSPNQSREIIL